MAETNDIQYPGRVSNGLKDISYAYTITTGIPIDDRETVKKFADLKDVNTWKKTGGTFTCYNGMTVSVVSDDDSEKNGRYMLQLDSGIKENGKIIDGATYVGSWIRLIENFNIIDAGTSSNVID